MRLFSRFGRNLVIWASCFGGSWLFTSLLLFVEPFNSWLPLGFRVFAIIYWLSAPLLPLYVLCHALFDTIFDSMDGSDDPPADPADRDREAGDRAQKALEDSLKDYKR